MLKGCLLSILFFFSYCYSTAQNKYQAIVKDKKTNETLIGVSAFIRSLKIGSATDANGKVEINNIPNGTYELVFSFIGYKSHEVEITFPSSHTNQIETILISENDPDLSEVIVTSTRTNNRIEEVPTRIDVVGQEEVNEEVAMHPGNITKLLGENSGIQTQQTSAVSGSMSFRILGLPGQYTQLLQDGFPVYSGFSSALSLVQTPPVDLRQVEIIKGSSTALYGGNAISGIVNLISKTPSDSVEWTILLNQTQKGGTDFSSFYSAKKDKFGITFLATETSQRPVDVNGDGFTDIPQLQQLTFKPKLFYYPTKSITLSLGLNTSYESRTGGDIYAIENSPDSTHSFVERQISYRNIAQFTAEKKCENGDILTLKSSMSDYKRTIGEADFNFAGNQVTSYSELSLLKSIKNHKIVFGANFLSDAFDENNMFTTRGSLDYNYQTTGVFGQDDWSVGQKLILETGIRTDYHNVYGTFVLPRISALYKITPKLYARLGGGLGYRTPTVFTDDAENLMYRNVYPVASNLEAEQSAGANFDINYNTLITDEVRLSFNQAIYYTVVNNALMPKGDSLLKGVLIYFNVNPGIEVLGSETNLKFNMDETELAIGYTYLDAEEKTNTRTSFLELTPRNRLVMSLVLGEENNWRIGFEEFYTGTQYLDNGGIGHDFWTTGAIIEKTFKHFSFIGNVENIFDVRQTRWGSIVIPPYNNPIFKEIYAPLDGVLINVAIKVKI
jgi:outer membrane receptor for ferrienterochelin and colicins